MADLFAPSIEDMIACAERELAYRRRVYPRRREAGQMTQALVDREMARMEAILKTLTRLRVTDSLQAMVELQTAARRVVWAFESTGQTALHELENIVGRPLREEDI